MFRSTVRSAILRRASVAFLACGVLGCSDSSTTPLTDSPEFISTSATDERTQWDVTSSFIFSAAAADTITPFPLDVRVPASISTSAGDREVVLMSRAVCANYVSCHELSVGVQAGRDLTSLSQLLDQQGARLASVNTRGTSGSVFVYEPLHKARIAAWLMRRGEVRWVEPMGMAFCGLSSCAPTARIFTAVKGGIRLRERTAPPTPFDNHLEVNPGDTITVSIPQPDGSVHQLQEIARPWGSLGRVQRQ